MALDFPTTVKLREEEHQTVMELVRREPLLSRAEVVIGVFAIGARIALEPAGFQELLGVLRQRRQGHTVIAPRKPPESVAAAPKRQGRCA